MLQQAGSLAGTLLKLRFHQVRFQNVDALSRSPAKMIHKFIHLH